MKSDKEKIHTRKTELRKKTRTETLNFSLNPYYFRKKKHKRSKKKKKS